MFELFFQLLWEVKLSKYLSDWLRSFFEKRAAQRDLEGTMTCGFVGDLQMDKNQFTARVIECAALNYNRGTVADTEQAIWRLLDSLGCVTRYTKVSIRTHGPRVEIEGTTFGSVSAQFRPE
ncbi:MAG: hypothetical protein Q8P30_03170 [Candidatus Uhrbacteria bacterium]|nr:hypothetical protein [Candidatus Uhrbacteria bacterium]